MGFQPSYTWGIMGVLYNLWSVINVQRNVRSFRPSITMPTRANLRSFAMLKRSPNTSPFHGERRKSSLSICQETPNQQGWHQCISRTWRRLFREPRSGPQVPNKARPSQASMGQSLETYHIITTNLGISSLVLCN